MFSLLKRCEPEQMPYLISKTQKMARKEKIPLEENEMLGRKKSAGSIFKTNIFLHNDTGLKEITKYHYQNI